MLILSKLAPELKVRFKTEKPGTNLIMPISSKEFFEGEKNIFGYFEGSNSRLGRVTEM